MFLRMLDSMVHQIFIVQGNADKVSSRIRCRISLSVCVIAGAGTSARGKVPYAGFIQPALFCDEIQRVNETANRLLSVVIPALLHVQDRFSVVVASSVTLGLVLRYAMMSDRCLRVFDLD